MFELLFCSSVTILPDYLFRRYVQGKRLGHEITLFSVWYELRWGLTLCVLLTVSLITLVFYFHPSSTNVTAMFRTVSILPERNGRVSEVYVGISDEVKEGQPLFKLDDTAQQAAAATARSRLAELDANAQLAEAQIDAAQAQLDASNSALDLANIEYDRNVELNKRNPNVVAQRELDRLQAQVKSAQGQVDAAKAQLETARKTLQVQIPAQKASAQAQLDEAQVQIDKSLVTAGTDGQLQQFTLRPGDVVNPMLRPAGIMVPAGAGRNQFVAGFDQISAEVLKVGMIGEITCPSRPMDVIPVFVTEVQDVYASGQFRSTDNLADVTTNRQPGTVLVFMAPIYKADEGKITLGSRCVANAYTSNYEKLEDPDLGLGTFVFYHVVDTVAIIHAAILRAQTLLLPVRTLVLGGH
ncbi:biotin/lipoyl-binding protein [Albimonas sp. CAU 1670]|uniref:HlyD family secretion protein n=1 Tax=Albimonas sp. CAU 1670 TaxID=3032599 RepID=UPI0023DB8A32|nr:biotin/lipoyl-binding protein [Albimonas sp. CAU 1670]MDF2233680.1 biotin/lipoyl-binding protein [Albimonas sp. CAU 1670]